MTIRIVAAAAAGTVLTLAAPAAYRASPLNPENAISAALPAVASAAQFIYENCDDLTDCDNTVLQASMRQGNAAAGFNYIGLGNIENGALRYGINTSVGNCEVNVWKPFGSYQNEFVMNYSCEGRALLGDDQEFMTGSVRYPSDTRAALPRVVQAMSRP